MGALTLNSCVDDTENIGVTNVRQAKAEQIKAVADYNKSLAEAEMINANKIKAAQEAIAEYNNARAKAEEARAAYKQAQADKQAALAEQAKIELQRAEMDLQNYAKKVELAAKDLEYQLLVWQKSIVQAKMDLAKAIKEAQPDEAAELQALLKTYTDASEDLATAQAKLQRNRLTLEQMKAGLVTTKEGYEKLIDQYTKDIQDLNDQISEKEAELAVLDGYTNIAEAKKDLDALAEQLNPLAQTYFDKLTAEELLTNKLQEAYTTMEGSAYKQNVDKTLYQNLIGDNWSWYFTYERNILQNSSDPYSIVIYSGEWKQNEQGDWEPKVIIPLFNGKNSKTEYIDYTYEEGQKVFTQSYPTYVNYYTPVKDGFTKFETAVKAGIKDNEEKALGDAKTAYTAKETAQKAAAAAKTAADAVLKAAQEAVTAAGENATEAQKQAVVDAKADVANKEAALKTANDQLADAAADQKRAQDALDKVNAKLAEIKALYDAAVADASSNEANMKAYNEVSLKLAEAKVALSKALNEYSNVYSKYSTLSRLIQNNGQDILNSIETIKGKIERLKSDITKKEAQIKALQAELAKGDDPNTLYLIQELESQIADIEASIPVLQKKYDIAKAALDAAMAEDAPAE